MKYAHMVAFLLLVVGGINWGLWGLFGFDLVGWLGFALGDIVAKAIYVLIGVAAVYELVTHKKNCRDCGGDAPKGVAPSM
jgi:uncharacterized protein